MTMLLRFAAATGHIIFDPPTNEGNMMANGAPRGDRVKQSKPTPEETRQLLEQMAQQPPFFEILEVRNFNASLIQIADDSFVLVYDTPGGRRYAFPMSRDQLGQMSEMLTRAKLGVPPVGGPPMPQGAAK